VRLTVAGRGPFSSHAHVVAPGAPYLACESSVPYDLIFSNLGQPWPALAARLVVIGGVTVTFNEAVNAAQVLMTSKTSAIQPVLRTAGNPLAGCDYFGVAAPYLEAARLAPKTGRAGAAGRHVTKNAFLEAVALTLTIVRETELTGALEAFGTDERYAVAMARDAVKLRESAYLSGVKSSVRSAVTRAVTACSALAGKFTCAEMTACGTGACRFAAPAHRGITVAAEAGRFQRPANHVQAGSLFSDAGAAGQLAAAGSALAGIQVYDTDRLQAGDRAA